MSSTPPLFRAVLTTRSPDQTAVLAQRIGDICGAGDCILLDGPIGAGKTHFARSLIQDRLARFGAIEDVPSPTFTLVQTYEAGPLEIWHADLYRLTHPDETLELGLDDAFDTALCLIEWPDRLGNLAPLGALRLSISSDAAAETRTITLTSDQRTWAQRLNAIVKEFSDDKN